MACAPAGAAEAEEPLALVAPEERHLHPHRVALAALDHLLIDDLGPLHECADVCLDDVARYGHILDRRRRVDLYARDLLGDLAVRIDDGRAARLHASLHGVARVRGRDARALDLDDGALPVRPCRRKGARAGRDEQRADERQEPPKGKPFSHVKNLLYGSAE